MLESIWTDLAHAYRSLARARAFTLVCVVSLGIGMAPVIAIPYFARVLRVPPPGVRTEGLVELITTPQGSEGEDDNWSYPDFLDLRDAQTGMTLFGWVHGTSRTTIQTPAGPQPDSVPTLFVTPNYFQAIGVALAQGPGFGAADQPVVILGDRFWRTRLGADPNIIGKTLTLDRVPHLVVGIAPPQFQGHESFEGRALFVPLDRHPLLQADNKARSDRDTRWLNIHGRLSPGVSITQASAAIAAVTAQLARQYPATNKLRAGIVVPYFSLGYRDRFVSMRIQAVGLTLTGMVLLVVCLNIAGMMMVRSAIRERELSIRSAIGASRGQLVRYLLTEALILAAVGGTLASAVLFTIPKVMLRFITQPIPPEVLIGLRVDLPMLAICMGLCFITSLLFGLLPAARFSRPVIISALRDDAGAGGLRVGRVHRLAAAMQVAIAVPLLVMSGISLERFRATAAADLGFASELLYAAPLTFDGAPGENVGFTLRSARESLQKADGVAAVTVADGLPLDFNGRTMRVSLQTDTNAAPTFVGAQVTRVGDGYLSTMGIPLVAGRGFTAGDGEGAELVTVLSKTLAARFFPNGTPTDAIGKRLTFGEDPKTQQTLTIVGVTADFPTAQMSTERDQLLVPLAQHPSPAVYLIARSAPGEQPMKMTAAVENAVHDLGPEFSHKLEVGDGVVYSQVITGVWLRQKSMRDFLVQSAVGGTAGGVILILGAIGIYGVVGLMVATRTREIAVRVALGASRRRVLNMILLNVVRLAMPGVAVGLVLTFVLLRLNSENMGIPLSSIEPLAYIVGAAIAVLMAIAASLAPAHRAASVQPLVAMRST